MGETTKIKIDLTDQISDLLASLGANPIVSTIVDDTYDYLNKMTTLVFNKDFVAACQSADNVINGVEKFAALPENKQWKSLSKKYFEQIAGKTKEKLRAKLNPQSFRNRERKFNNLAIVIRVIMMMSDDFTKYNVNN